MVVALCLVTALVIVLRRPDTASRVDRVFAAASGQGQGASGQGGDTVIPVAAQIEVSTDSPAIDPGALRTILDLAGWDTARLSQFGDGEPLTDQQREQLLDLLRRVRSIDAANVADWSNHQVSLSQIAANADAHRGELIHLAGRVKHVTRRTLPPELALRFEIPAYLESVITLDAGGTATVISARVPDAWTNIESLDEPAAADGIFVKLLPSDDNQPAALFVSRDVAWRPTKPLPPYVNLSRAVLGALGMDVGLLDDLQQRRPLRAGESDAFYSMLAAAKRASNDQLVDLARGNLHAVRDAWLALEKQTESGPTSADREKWKLAREVVERADEGKYSVAPLFNEPAEQVGELVLLEGLARRAARVEVGPSSNGRPSTIPRRFGIDHYYEVDIFTDDSQNNPIVFCAIELPAGFPTGESIREPVRVAGFFFKSWSFESRRARQPSDDTAEPVAARQFAPLVIGHSPLWIQPPTATGPDYTAYIAAGLFAVLLVGVWVTGWWMARGDRRFAHEMLHDRFSLPPGETLDNLDLPGNEEPQDSRSTV